MDSFNQGLPAEHLLLWRPEESWSTIWRGEAWTRYDVNAEARYYLKRQGAVVRRLRLALWRRATTPSSLIPLFSGKTGKRTPFELRLRCE